MGKPGKLFTYLIVGSTAYVVEIITLFILTHALHYSSFRSVAISFWIGFIVAFVLQKLITFKNYDKRRSDITRQLVLYGLLVGFNYGFTLLMVRLFETRASVYIVRTFAIMTVTSWNYFLYKHIFRQSNSDHAVEGPHENAKT